MLYVNVEVLTTAYFKTVTSVQMQACTCVRGKTLHKREIMVGVTVKRKVQNRVPMFI